MKIKEFNLIYENAKKVKIIENEWFLTQVWFWINLTTIQTKKMYDLMILQGAEEQEGQYISLPNGVRIYCKR